MERLFLQAHNNTVGLAQINDTILKCFECQGTLQMYQSQYSNNRNVLLYCKACLLLFVESSDNLAICEIRIRCPCCVQHNLNKDLVCNRSCKKQFKIIVAASEYPFSPSYDINNQLRHIENNYFLVQLPVSIPKQFSDPSHVAHVAWKLRELKDLLKLEN